VRCYYRAGRCVPVPMATGLGTPSSDNGVGARACVRVEKRPRGVRYLSRRGRGNSRRIGRPAMPFVFGRGASPPARGNASGFRRPGEECTGRKHVVLLDGKL